MMRPQLAPRLSAWPCLLLCLLAVFSWSERNTAQAHINITWADNSTVSFPTTDFFNLRVPYYEKQGTLIYGRIKLNSCEYKDLPDKYKDMLKEHLAKTGTKQEVAVLLDAKAIYYSNCYTIIQVSFCHAD